VTKPLRVLQLANQPGPLVLFERPVCDALREAGADVHLACMRVGALAPRLDEMDYPVHDLPPGPWSRVRTWTRLYRRLRRLLRDEQFDVMIVHTPVMSWIARFAARGLVPAAIYLAHGLPFAPTQSPMRYHMYRFIEKRLAKYTDAVLVMNQADDEACRQHRLTRTGEHCYKIPGVGVDVSFWAAPPDSDRLAQLNRDLALDADRPVVLFLGRFIDDKRPADVLAVARSVGPGAWFVLAGEGPLWESVHRQAREIGDRVRVVPFSDDPHVLVHRSAVVVLPSVFREGLPRVLLEAQAAGRPVVAYDVRGSSDAVDDGQTGVIVAPRDVAGLTEAVAQFLADGPRRQAFGERAAAWIADHFSLERSVEAQMAAFRTVLAEKGLVL